MSITIRSTVLLALYATLPFFTSVNALGCFTSGELYGDLTTNGTALEEARTDFCELATSSGTYPQGASESGCFPFGENRLNFMVINNSGTTQTLTMGDCVAALTIEMNACSMGSMQNHGSFQYLDDPNAGACTAAKRSLTF